MKSFSTVAVLAILSGSALANEAVHTRAPREDFVDLAARAEIDNFVNKFKSFTDDEKNRIKDTVTTGFKGLKKLEGGKKGGPKKGDAKKPQPQAQRRAAPGKAPAPPSGGSGRGAAGILGGAGAAAGTNLGLKKLLNETERHHNGTRHHKGDRHNKTRDGNAESILTNLFERNPAKSGSGSGVGSAVAGGVASGAASAGLSNLLNEIESHFKRQVFAIGEIDGHPIDPKLNHGNTGSSPVHEGSAGGVIRERDDLLREIQGYLQRRRLAEISESVTRRALDNHDAYFADLLAARNAGAIDDLD